MENLLKEVEGIVDESMLVFLQQGETFSFRHKKVMHPLTQLLANAGIGEGLALREFLRYIAQTAGNGNKIEAIKLVRAMTGAGLKESKEFVEELIAMYERPEEQEPAPEHQWYP